MLSYTRFSQCKLSFMTLIRCILYKYCATQLMRGLQSIILNMILIVIYVEFHTVPVSPFFLSLSLSHHHIRISGSGSNPKKIHVNTGKARIVDTIKPKNGVHQKFLNRTLIPRKHSRLCVYSVKHCTEIDFLFCFKPFNLLSIDNIFSILAECYFANCSILSENFIQI